MLRVLHTADWHLGHALHSLPRDREHRLFLDWLLDTIIESGVHAVLVCGDVFETINPPASALAALYGFLATLHRRRPDVQVVVVGGNHDSAARLESASELLAAIGVRVVGSIRRDVDGALDVDRLIIPLRGDSAGVEALCAAVPFLRIADLRRENTDEAVDPLIAGVRQVYDDVFARMRTRRAADHAMIATGHCYMVGAEISALSERRILGGNQHALPVDIFPEDVAYAALGHLHKAQCVGRRENVRYSGSPIPLSMGEIDYAHQVVISSFEAGRCIEIEPVRVPRSVEFLRVPRRGFGDLEEVAAELRALPEHDPAVEQAMRPFLEVRVALSKPEPELRSVVECALAGRAARLVKLSVELTGHGRTLSEQASPEQRLSELEPETVFRSAYARVHDGEPDPELCAEFDALLDAVYSEDAG